MIFILEDYRENEIYKYLGYYWFMVSVVLSVNYNYYYLYFCKFLVFLKLKII